MLQTEDFVERGSDSNSDTKSEENTTYEGSLDASFLRGMLHVTSLESLTERDIELVKARLSQPSSPMKGALRRVGSFDLRNGIGWSKKVVISADCIKTKV